MDPSDSIDGQEHFVKARDAALRFLTYRARSEAEVRRRLSLSRKRYSPEIIQRVIETLLQQRYLDDGSFAQEWRDNRERHHPRAQRMVQQELRGLGVSAAVIRESLDGFSDEANARAAGLKLARKLADRNFSDEEFRRRISSLLRRRGFSHSMIQETVERLCRELGADSLHRQHDPEDYEEDPQTPDAESYGNTQQSQQR
jgi:regulatory protein